MHVLVSVRIHKNSYGCLKNKLQNILLRAQARIAAAAAAAAQEK